MRGGYKTFSSKPYPLIHIWFFPQVLCAQTHCTGGATFALFRCLRILAGESRRKYETVSRGVYRTKKHLTLSLFERYPKTTSEYRTRLTDSKRLICAVYRHFPHTPHDVDTTMVTPFFARLRLCGETVLANSPLFERGKSLKTPHKRRTRRSKR